MKKQFILLLVFALFAVGLGGLLWFLYDSVPEKGVESSSAVQAEVSLFQKEQDELVSVKVSNPSGGFAVDFAEDLIQVANIDESIPLKQSKLESLRSALLSVTAVQKIEQVSALSDFGLEQPRASVKASYSDGSMFGFEIGADAPGGENVYCKTDDGKVYVFAQQKVANFLNGLVDFVDTAVTALPQTDGEQPVQVKQAAFTGTAYPQPLTMRRKAGNDAVLESYSFESPGHGSVDSDKEQYIANLINLQAEKVAAIHPTNDQLNECGLSEPVASVQFSYDASGVEQTCVLNVGEADNAIYLMRDDRPVIYQMAAESVPWLGLDYGDFVSRRAPMPSIWDVASVTVTTAQQTVVFELSGKDDDFSVVCGEKNLDVDKFKSYYQTLIGISADEYTQTQPDSETPLFTIKYTYRDSAKPADTVQFFDGPTRRVIMQVNGGDRFLLKEKQLELLVKNTESMQTGGEIELVI